MIARTRFKSGLLLLLVTALAAVPAREAFALIMGGDRYIFHGHPNPSSGDQRTEPATIDLKGGQKAEITLNAK